MGATGVKGIDVRQTANGLIFRASLKNSSGAILATGTTELRLFEVQDDGSLHVFDFYASTLDFTSGTPSDDEAEMTKRTHLDDGGNPRETGIWTYKLADVSKFVKGAIYIAQVTNSGASPVDQEREFQFGDVEGDLAVTDTDLLKADAEEWAGAQVLLSSGMAGSNVPLVAHTNDGAAKVTLASSTDKQPASLATADVTGNLPANVVDWKGATAPAMTGDAFARLGAPAGDSVSADIAGIHAKTTNLPASPAAVGSAMTLATGAITYSTFGSSAITSGAFATDAISAAALSSAAVAKIVAGQADVYTAKVTRGRNGNTEIYLVNWFKNGAAILASITDATITVMPVTTPASPLISAATLNADGLAYGYLYYSADPSTEKSAAGVMYGATLSAVIDGDTRTFPWGVVKDA
ncbi:MAG: hypothetical protein ABFD92_21685 [Planctomycetaceae bacterium]